MKYEKGKTAGTSSRPEPEAFSFRPQQPGESPQEYEYLKGRAKARHSRQGGGRSGAIKGKLHGKMGASSC